MIYVIIGRRELGKSTLARYLGHARTPRLTIDPRAQWPIASYAGDPGEADDHAPAVVDAVDAEQVLEDLGAGQDVIVQPDDLDRSIQALAWPARAYIMGSAGRQLTITFDEAGLYKDALRQHWSWMMRCSPRDRTTILLTAHRPADIATDIRALADIWCIFRTTQEHDLDAIEDRCGPEVRALVQTLKPYEFVSWNDALAKMDHHKNPRAWFTPAATPLQGEPIEPRRRGLF
jgi:hypothetical protein